MAAAIPPKISKWVDVGVSAGASLVILGALFKIVHHHLADTFLWIGLVTESLIFLIYAVLYAIYPAVGDNAGGHDEEQFAVATKGSSKVAVSSTGGAAVLALDKVMSEAQITPDIMNKIGEGFKQLNQTVAGLNGVSGSLAATEEFANKTKAVTAELEKVKNAYANAAESVGAFNSATDSAKTFSEQVKVLSGNMSSLNAIYELELKESNNHLKALSGFYGKLAETSNSLLKSADDAQKVQEQIGNLAGNLNKLNSIYGNMLSAMQGRN